MLRRERLAAFVRGFGQRDPKAVNNGVFIAKELKNLQFDKAVDLQERDYVFRALSTDSIFCPDVSIDLRSMGKIKPIEKEDLKVFYEMGKILERYDDRSLALAAQAIWNYGKCLPRTEEKESMKILREIENQISL